MSMIGIYLCFLPEITFWRSGLLRSKSRDEKINQTLTAVR